ncbi:MAG: VTT domain-containing protein [Acidobacteriaceae bacterium]|nr:VTT domain-containing protein [Acidobacteriaceae bacterium]
MGYVEFLARPVRKRQSSMLAVFRHLGVAGLFALAILDSTPLPTFGGPDILIVILVLTHRNPWYECAIAATVGSVVGALITFKLARRAGRAYLDSKFGQQRVPKLLKLFDRWGTGALVASTAIPFPSPTSVFFAAAGASNSYRTSKYLAVVGLSRAFRYSAVAIIGELYGRHFIRVLRHPTQYWGWFMLVAAIFFALLAAGILYRRRFAEANV